MLPKIIKFWFRIIRELLNYVSPIILGIIVYHFWVEDWKITAILLGILIIQQISEIIKRERIKSH
jgi:hypothetical protein